MVFSGFIADHSHPLLEALRAIAASLPSHVGVPFSEFEIKDFNHDGMSVRGIGTNENLESHQVILSLPKRLQMTSDDALDARFTGQKHDRWGIFRLSLLLAEKKAELLAIPYNKLSPEERFWATAIQSFPTLEDYKAQGLPLLQPETESGAKDLERLMGLPRLGDIPVWVMNQQSKLTEAIRTYNKLRGNHPMLKWEDMLWAFTTVAERSFMTPSGSTLAPVGDLLNQPEGNGNVYFHVIRQEDVDSGRAALDHASVGDIQFRTEERINAGEELTLSYHNSNSEKWDPIAWIMQYGMQLPKGQIRKWPREHCANLRSAHLEGGGQFLKTVRHVIASSCQDHFTNGDSGIGKVAMQFDEPGLRIASGSSSGRHNDDHLVQTAPTNARTVEKNDDQTDNIIDKHQVGVAHTALGPAAVRGHDVNLAQKDLANIRVVEKNEVLKDRDEVGEYQKLPVNLPWEMKTIHESAMNPLSVLLLHACGLRLSNRRAMEWQPYKAKKDHLVEKLNFL